MAEPFGVAVMAIKANDDHLKRTLREDEAVVKASVGKMQADLDKLQVSTQGTSETSFQATAVFGALGSQMAAVGGIAGSLGGKIVSLGGNFANLGKAMLGPAGAVLALSATLTVLVQRWIDARDAARAYAAAEKEAAAAREAATQKFLTTTTTAGFGLRGQVLGLQAGAAGPIAVLKEAQAAQFDEISRQQQKLRGTLKEELGSDIERFGFDEAIRRFGAPNIVKTPWTANILEMGEQINLLARKRELIEDKTNRAIQKINDDRRKAEFEAEKAHAAQVAALREQALARARATPLGQVVTTLQGLIAGRQYEKALEDAIGMFGGGSDTLRRALGLSVDTATQGPGRGGHMLLSAFAGSGRTGAGPQFATAREEQRENKKAVDISELRRLLANIEGIFALHPDLFKKQGSPGN